MPDTAAVNHLAEELSGQLLRPNHPDYDDARKVWNGMIDRRPALIARCADASDVVAAVKFARSQNMIVSVKGGGHSVAGKAVCDDGLMIDLSAMNSVQVDVDARTAVVGAGARLADLDGESQKHGLATTGGVVSTTGVAGLTLGGGMGYLARRFGLTLDNLLSAQVVTASGELIRASKSEHPDLFWGLTGGGGNFGVVTSFEFQLHEVGPDILAAQIFYPMSDATRVLHAYRDVMADAPDELSCYALVVHVPPADPFPEQHHGETALALIACYSGDIEAGRSLLAPLTDLGDPIFQHIGPMPYAALQQGFDAGVPDGGRWYWKSDYMETISDEAIETFLTHARSLHGPMSMAGFEPMGGAVNRISPDATAFPHRSANFALGIYAGWNEPADDEKNIGWARTFHQAMTRFGTGGVYVNYLDADESDRIEAAFGPNYERLRHIKAKYDPDNFFRLNNNIGPAGGS